MDVQLSMLANSLADLLLCDGVCIVLHCDDAALRHPLLTLYLRQYAQKMTYYGTLAYPEILLGERFRALCDVAAQSASTHVLFSSTEAENSLSGVVFVCPMSMMVAPLELAEGIVGFVLCTDIRPDAFSEGEIHLLQYQLSSLAFKVEHFLYQHLIDSVDRAISSRISSPSVSSVQTTETTPLPSIQPGEVAESITVPSSLEPSSFDDTPTQPALPAVALPSTKSTQSLSSPQNHPESSGTPYLDLVELCHNLLLRVQQHWMRIPTDDSVVRSDSQRYRYTIYCVFDTTISIAPAYVDNVRLVLLHLLENALLYSPQGGLIEILIRRRTPLHAVSLVPFSLSVPSDYRSSCVYVTVRDHGIGIPARYQSLVLQPFTRLYHPRTYRRAGRGLGLYIAHRIVEKMHGQLFLKSRLGHGTSITFTLPDKGSPRLFAQ